MNKINKIFNHNEHNFLPLYCIYPVSWAQNELNSSKEYLYQITTIDWTYATNIETGQTDYDYVHKNIYEMTLEKYLNWVKGLKNEEVINVEKISE